MSKLNEIRLGLIKTTNSFSVVNHDEATMEMFEDDDVGRKAFVQYMIDNFLNKEVDNGRKYR